MTSGWRRWKKPSGFPNLCPSPRGLKRRNVPDGGTAGRDSLHQPGCLSPLGPTPGSARLCTSESKLCRAQPRGAEVVKPQAASLFPNESQGAGVCVTESTEWLYRSGSTRVAYLAVPGEAPRDWLWFWKELLRRATLGIPVSRSSQMAWSLSPPPADLLAAPTSHTPRGAWPSVAITPLSLPSPGSAGELAQRSII